MTFITFAPNTVAKSDEVNDNFNDAVHKTDTQKIQNKINVPPHVTATDGATVTFNLDNGNIHSVTLGGNRALALSNDSTWQPFILRLKQDGTGGRTVTWFSGIKWPGGVAPVLTTAGNAVDVFGFIKTAVGAYDGYIVGMGLS